MLALDERLDRVADILVEGLLHLLVAEGRVEDADVLPADDRPIDRLSFGVDEDDRE